MLAALVLQSVAIPTALADGSGSVEVSPCALRGNIGAYAGKRISISGTIFHYPDALFVDDPDRAAGDGCAVFLGKRLATAPDFGAPGGPPFTTKFKGRVSGVYTAYTAVSRYTGKPEIFYRLDEWEATATP